MDAQPTDGGVEWIRKVLFSSASRLMALVSYPGTPCTYKIWWEGVELGEV